MDQNTKTPAELFATFVNKFYEMDPATEDLIEGNELKDGMKVLIGEPIYREETAFLKENDTIDLEGFSAYKLDRARECNRWCTVSRVKVSYAGTVSFFGTYEDGTKRKRTYSSSHVWLVKLDSIPQDEEAGNEKGCCINCWYSISKTCGDSSCVCHDPARNNR